MKLKSVIKLAFLALILVACNSKGKHDPYFKNWAKTPPMGWNSWDCFGPSVVEDEVKALFKFPYEVGELKAVGVHEDEEEESVILRTAKEASKITLKADCSTIPADGQDLAYITVEITDENGVLNPNANNQLQFKISGPGEIIGVDNADLKDTDSYQSDNRKAWKGKALVIVKSNREAGNIQLEVSSEGLVAETINISSK